MERPIPQNTFLMETVPFQEPRRSFVLQIANGPNPEHGRNREGPFDDRAQRFAHETLSPKRTGQKITEIDPLILPRGDGANQLFIVAPEDQPAIRFTSLPVLQKPLDDFDRVVQITVRKKREVTDDFRVLRIG